MANKTFQGRIVQKHDTKANWDKATNFVPLKGEIIIYDDLKKIKIGDGATKVGNLDFINDLDTINGKYLPLTGGTMTGDIDLNNNSITNLHSLILNNDNNTPLMLTGYTDGSGLSCLSLFDGVGENIRVIGVNDPIDDYEVANKRYVDDQITANASSTIIKTWTDDGT